MSDSKDIQRHSGLVERVSRVYLLLPLLHSFSCFLLPSAASSSLLLAPVALSACWYLPCWTCQHLSQVEVVLIFFSFAYSLHLGWLWLMTKWLPGKLESPCHQLMRLNGRCCTELFEHLLQLLPSFTLLTPLLVETLQKGQGWPKQKCLNMCKGANK